MKMVNLEDVYQVLTEYYHHKTETQHEALREALIRVPSAERHGYDTGEGRLFHCSVCGYDVFDIYEGNRDVYRLDGFGKGWDYCPCCGAKMDER